MIGVTVVLAVSAVIIALVFAFILNSKRSDAAAATASSLIGKPAPGFSMPTTDGRRVALSDFKGRQSVLLYFSEGAGCQACITQMKSLENARGSFSRDNLTILPIVMDSKEAITQAMRQFDVTTPFLMDDGTASKAYHALGTGMHADLPGHGFVLVDKQGVVRWAKNYPSMWVSPKDLLSQIRDV